MKVEYHCSIKRELTEEEINTISLLAINNRDLLDYNRYNNYYGISKYYDNTNLKDEKNNKYNVFLEEELNTIDTINTLLKEEIVNNYISFGGILYNNDGSIYGIRFIYTWDAIICFRGVGFIYFKY